jgi:hypothetical protein
MQTLLGQTELVKWITRITSARITGERMELSIKSGNFEMFLFCVNIYGAYRVFGSDARQYSNIAARCQNNAVIEWIEKRCGAFDVEWEDAEE